MATKIAVINKRLSRELEQLRKEAVGYCIMISEGTEGHHKYKLLMGQAKKTYEEYRPIWIKGCVGLAATFVKLRDLYTDKELNSILDELKIGSNMISKDDRAALIQMGKDLVRMEKVFNRSRRWSIRLIYKHEYFVDRKDITKARLMRQEITDNMEVVMKYLIEARHPLAESMIKYLNDGFIRIHVKPDKEAGLKDNPIFTIEQYDAITVLFERTNPKLYEYWMNNRGRLTE